MNRKPIIHLNPLFVTAVAGLLGLSAACTVAGPNELRDTQDDGGSSVTVGGGGNIGFTGSTGSGDQGGGFDTCAEATDEAKLVPINMYIAVDKSGSMDSNNKWNNAKSAFTTFFQDAAADSLNVALRFWPDSGCGDNDCNPAGCAVPQVPLGSLEDSNHEQQLIAAFNAKYPGGGTPMSAALGGATQWCIDNQANNMGAEVSVVLLLSDGAPTQCDESTNGLTSLAANAYNQAKILTFAVGLQGSNENLMNAIAQAGQTQKGYFIGNGNAKDDLLAALKDIQKNAVACAFAMPESNNSKDVVDPTKVNVTYTPGGATEAQTLPQTAGEEFCSPQTGGWYYDDPDDPQVIKLCPSTCAGIQSDDGGKLAIVVGCKTVVD